MADQVAPNVLVFEPSSGKMSELFQNEEIALSIWGSGRTKSLADTGFPAKFAYPEEGAVALMIAVCPVVNSDVPEEAQAFIQYVLSPEIQVRLADVMGAGPSNKTAELPVRMPLFPWLQLTALGLLIAILITMGLDEEFWDISWIVGVPWLALLSVVYFVWRPRRDRALAYGTDRAA